MMKDLDCIYKVKLSHSRQNKCVRKLDFMLKSLL